ncbi:MAG TPA: ribulose-phosphate 3-epimerase [Thermoanaerobaculia bacterium]|nr:ribulose-phosphate 3-epimerase [Thermoanaerobaculia bacterium]
MSEIRIAPSILSADFAHLGDDLRQIEEGGADLVHLDVMDGHFVPNITFGPALVSAARKVTSLPFDCHLMIAEPQRYIDRFLDAGANMISIHIETEPHLERALSMIRAGGALAGIAINPATSADLLADAIEFCDYILVMSVNPGFGGQKFIRPAVDKIRRIAGMLESRGLRTPIEVDGGIDPGTARDVVLAGASILVAGSAIFGLPDRVEAIRTLRVAATSTEA